MDSIGRKAFVVLFLIEFLTSNKEIGISAYTFEKRVNRALHKCSGGRKRDLVQITGDGNCLFRSIAYCFWDDQAYHATIRKHIIDYVADNWYYYGDSAMSDHQVNSAGEHRTTMGAIGAWGGDVELAAATRVFSLNFRIYQESGKILKVEDPTNTKICGLYYDGTHYSVVEDRSIY